jgi:hypothetical protein
MGEVIVYLIPETNIEDPRKARAEIVRQLQSEGIILDRKDHFYPTSERSECYVVGKNNLAAFDLDETDGDWAFQRCTIYGYPYLEVVPQIPGVQPSCPACSVDVSAAYYEFITRREELLEPMTCPACGQLSRIDALKDGVGIFLTNLFVSFSDTGEAQMKPQWLQQFSAKTGIRFRMLSYWHT